MRKWALRSVIVLLLLGLLTGTRVGYSADCVLCLRRERGDDFNLFGLRVLHLHQPATDRAGPLQDSYRLPSIPSGDPATLDLLLATPCAHVFKRDGFGRSSLLFGGVACGGYAEGSVFAGRRYALSALAHLHSRVPATPLARQTLAIIDHTFPATLPLDEALHPHERSERLTDISTLLNLISNEAEWRRALAFLQPPDPPTLTNPASFLEDLEFLTAKLASPDPILRQTSAALIAQLKPSSGEIPLSTLLASSDPLVVDRAASAILSQRRFDLFAPMLRARKSPPDDLWLKNYTQPEIITLLAQDDPVVDSFCFAAITVGEYLALLDNVVARLNTRDSAEARATIAALIRGPNPLDGKSDPWETLEPLQLPTDELKHYLDVGTAPKVRDPRKQKFLHAVKGLAQSGTPSDWDFLRTTYLREVTRGVNETHGAIMARALMTLDAARTRPFLIAELTTDDHRRQTAALAGMGLIADPVFLQPIENFRQTPPPSSPKNPYPAATIFKNPYYARYLDYALHRTRGIHLWQLTQTRPGHYSITKPLPPR